MDLWDRWGLEDQWVWDQEVQWGLVDLWDQEDQWGWDLEAIWEATMDLWDLEDPWDQMDRWVMEWGLMDLWICQMDQWADMVHQWDTWGHPWVCLQCLDLCQCPLCLDLDLCHQCLTCQCPQWEDLWDRGARWDLVGQWGLEDQCQSPLLE